nr:hypothetical protein [Tanacetum cinerariifolium]
LSLVIVEGVSENDSTCMFGPTWWTGCDIVGEIGPYLGGAARRCAYYVVLLRIVEEWQSAIIARLSNLYVRSHNIIKSEPNYTFRYKDYKSGNVTAKPGSYAILATPFSLCTLKIIGSVLNHGWQIIKFAAMAEQMIRFVVYSLYYQAGFLVSYNRLSGGFLRETHSSDFFHLQH